jgi:hypothetical protein
MSGHLKSIGVGAVLLIVGLALWLSTRQVETPVFSLSKIGVVLAFLGGLEVVVSGGALALSATRRGKR